MALPPCEVHNFDRERPRFQTTVRSVSACGSGLLGCYRGRGATPRHCTGASATKQERHRSGEAGCGHHSTGISQIQRPLGRCETSLTERSARETIISHPSEKQRSSEIVLLSFESWSNEIVPPTLTPHPKSICDHGGGPAKTGSFKKLVSSQTGNPEGRAYFVYIFYSSRKIHMVPKPCRPPTCRGRPGGKSFLLSSS